jgi:uncharacterized protein
MDPLSQDILNTLSLELHIPPQQVGAAAALLDDGNTLPFVARYRKR